MSPQKETTKEITLEGMSIEQIHQHYRNQDFTVNELMDYLLEQANQSKDDNSWIRLLEKSEVQIYLDKLATKSIDELPLYGIPFAIKDNIDLAGIPTTAACQEFAYTPEQSAFVVQQLIAAGAIPIGKTNLDQFATGLVGTRSPYGAVHNSLNPNRISGGSSSGSATTVAKGLVSFSLGTDTAGSGRIPAAFNNIIGFKPSKGLLSNQGVVPACQSLDCVAIFTANSHDLSVLLDVMAVYDPLDPFSKNMAPKQAQEKNQFTFAVPQPEQLEFFGNSYFQHQFEVAIEHLQKLGGEKIVIDFQPFMDAAKLLYGGPWVTERYLAAKDIVDKQPEVLLDVIRTIIEPGKNNQATDVFASIYELNHLKQQTDACLQFVDFLVTPTAGTIYDINEVNQDPIQLNSNLGFYTNYMNLLDYSAVALPFSLSNKKTPFGITMVKPAFADKELIALAKIWQQSLDVPLGARDWRFNSPLQIDSDGNNEGADETEMNIVVCGAHMSDLPLNYQLTERQAIKIKSSYTAPYYKLFALAGGPPKRPGLVRQSEQTSAIEVEVWRIPLEHVGSFLQGIPHPLGLGKVELQDGSFETGFICEPYISDEAEDISSLGSWRNYIKMKN